MVEITLQLPDTVAARLLPIKSRIPEVLALGLSELSPLPNQVYRYILEFLSSDPTPQAVVDFAPTPDMSRRASELLEKKRVGQLTTSESEELEEYARIDHLITMLKAHLLASLPTTAKP